MINPIHTGPTLQSVTRTGKVKYWRAHITKNPLGVHFLVKEWWQDGSAVQLSTPRRVEGKNIGKANETTPLEQAHSELDSLYQKQRDKGYSEDGSQAHIYPKPMLAHTWSKRKHNIVYPAYAQPKLDGVRMLMSNTATWSRGGKDFIPEVVQHLRMHTRGYIFDGELMIPGNHELQVTSRAYKSVNEHNGALHYFVYDLLLEDVPFEERLRQLKLLLDVPDVPGQVHLVPTRRVWAEEEVMEVHQANIAAGYEGTIIRNAAGLYESHRSPNLLKLKDFQDSEFPVVDIVDGKGSFKGKAIVVCQTLNGTTFSATPRCSMEERAEIFENREHYIGKWYTVRYQYLSEDGIPVGNTVGIEFRDTGEF